MLIWSNPIRDFIFFAAFCAALPALLVLLVRLEAASEAPLRLSPASAAEAAISDTPLLPPSLALFPVISSVNALNAFASVASLPIAMLITLITGVNRLISPCPIVAMSDCVCRLRILHWLAHESDVRAKSPCAADSWS